MASGGEIPFRSYSNVHVKNTLEVPSALSINGNSDDKSDAAISDEPMMDLEWFHPHLTRHAADCILIDNAPEGSYLLRPVEDSGHYALSVKMSASVQHIRVERTKDGYKFGQYAFKSVKEMKKHFEVEKPVIGGDSGITVHLTYPYSRHCDEDHMYLDIVTHTVQRLTDRGPPGYASLKRLGSITVHDKPSECVSFPVASREGYLTKVGKVRKSWKVRWFVLRNEFLSYYKTRQSSNPVRKLNLKEATEVKIDHSKGKQNCISVVFPWRTFYLIADSSEDCDQWLSMLASKTK